MKNILSLCNLPPSSSSLCLPSWIRYSKCELLHGSALPLVLMFLISCITCGRAGTGWQLLAVWSGCPLLWALFLLVTWDHDMAPVPRWSSGGRADHMWIVDCGSGLLSLLALALNLMACITEEDCFGWGQYFFSKKNIQVQSNCLAVAVLVMATVLALL